MSALSMKKRLVAAVIALALTLAAVLVTVANFPASAHTWGGDLTLERADVHADGDVS